MSAHKLLINAVSCRTGGGLNDLVHTLPLLEQMLGPRGWKIETFVVEAGADALIRSGHPIDRVRVAGVESPFGRANWELRTLPAIVRRDQPDAVFQFSNLIFRDLDAPQVTVLR